MTRKKTGGKKKSPVYVSYTFTWPLIEGRGEPPEFSAFVQSTIRATASLLTVPELQHLTFMPPPTRLVVERGKITMPFGQVSLNQRSTHTRTVTCPSGAI